MRGLAASWVLLSCLTTALGVHAQRSVLVAWTGDADRKHSDFVAVIDADPDSENNFDRLGIVDLAAGPGLILSLPLMAARSDEDLAD